MYGPAAVGTRVAFTADMLWLMLLSSPPLMTVVADRVHLRDGPSVEAESLARLRVDSEVRVHRFVGGYADVSVDAPTRSVRGFIPRQLLSDAPQSVDQLEARVMASLNADAAADALHWAERLLAKDPTSERLVWLHARAPSIAGAVAARLARAPTLLAMCEPKERDLVPSGADARVVLVGELAPGADGRIRLTRRALDDATIAAVEGSAWYPLGADAPIAGSPFLGWSPRPIWNERGEHEGPPAIGDDELGLALGPCDAPGALFATRRFRAVPTAPAASSESVEPAARAALAERFSSFPHQTRPSAEVRWLLGDGAMLLFGEIVVDLEDHVDALGTIHNVELVVGERAVAAARGQLGFEARLVAWFELDGSKDRFGLVEIDGGAPEKSRSRTVELLGITPVGEVEPRGEVELSGEGC